jgi:hypothetical protein
MKRYEVKMKDGSQYFVSSAMPDHREDGSVWFFTHAGTPVLALAPGTWVSIQETSDTYRFKKYRQSVFDVMRDQADERS